MNTQVYNFDKADLLTIDDLKKIMREIMPSETANYLYPVLKKYVCYSNGSYYTLQNNFSYMKDATISFLELKISYLLSASFNALKQELKDELKEHYAKSVIALCKIQSISNYTPFIDQLFKMNEVKMNTYTNQIHFNNGYIDILDKQFKQRTINNYISEFIKYDYIPSTKHQQQELLKMTIDKIIPNAEDQTCLFDILGSAMTGTSTDDNCCLFLYGFGSAGKSTILDICEAALGCYVLEIKNDLFSQSSNDYNKVLNTFANKQHIRFTICHELKDERIDGSRFKSFTEGKMNTTKLYQEESHAIRHNSKPIFTSNTIPNFVVDTGVIRRTKAYEQKSKFVDDVNEVDESQQIYLKDKKLKKTIEDDVTLKCAWIDKLVSHAYNYNKTQTIHYTPAFNATKELIISTNDWIQDFIDMKLVVTTNDTDRISKDHMQKLISETHKERHLSIAQLITSLKEHKIQYKCDYRINNVKGCFVGVKVKDIEINADELDEGIQQDDNNERIKFLESQLQQLQKIIRDKDAIIDKMMNEISQNAVITPKKEHTQQKTFSIESKIKYDKHEFDEVLDDEVYDQITNFSINNTDDIITTILDFSM